MSSYRVTTTTCRPSQRPACLLHLRCRSRRTAWLSPRPGATTTISAAFADLARPGLRVAVCGGPGACGSATRQLEDRTGVRLHPQNFDTTDSDVLKDITSGKVDVGLVFKTDALNVGDNVSWCAFPEAADATVTSWIAPMKNSDRAELATKFIQDVTSATGRKVFADDGFAEQTRNLRANRARVPRGGSPGVMTRLELC